MAGEFSWGQRNGDNHETKNKAKIITGNKKSKETENACYHSEGNKELAVSGSEARVECQRQMKSSCFTNNHSAEDRERAYCGERKSICGRSIEPPNRCLQSSHWACQNRLGGSV